MNTTLQHADFFNDAIDYTAIAIQEAKEQLERWARGQQRRTKNNQATVVL